jgi:hypothetical protein
MRLILRDGVLFTAVYVAAMWLLLAAFRNLLVFAFNATGTGAEISGPMWFFVGLLFVANAAFNNLGFPLLSTAFNWSRATLGTIPFAAVAARYGRPEAILAAVALGSVLFGALAIVVAFRTVRVLERGGAPKIA